MANAEGPTVYRLVLGTASVNLNFGYSKVLADKNLATCGQQSRKSTRMDRRDLRGRRRNRLTRCTLTASEDVTTAHVFTANAVCGLPGNFPGRSSTQTPQIKNCHSGIWRFAEFGSSRMLSLEGVVHAPAARQCRIVVAVS